MIGCTGPPEVGSRLPARARLVCVPLGDAGGRGELGATRPVSKEVPMEVLDRRFAEGESSEEDYRARRELLAGRGEPLVRA